MCHSDAKYMLYFVIFLPVVLHYQYFMTWTFDEIVYDLEEEVYKMEHPERWYTRGMISFLTRTAGLKLRRRFVERTEEEQEEYRQQVLRLEEGRTSGTQLTRGSGVERENARIRREERERLRLMEEESDAMGSETEVQGTAASESAVEGVSEAVRVWWTSVWECGTERMRGVMDRAVRFVTVDERQEEEEEEGELSESSDAGNVPA